MNSILAIQGLLRDVADLGCTVTLELVESCPNGLKVIVSWPGKDGLPCTVWTSFYEINNEYEFIRGLINLAEAARKGRESDA